MALVPRNRRWRPCIIDSPCRNEDRIRSDSGTGSNVRGPSVTIFIHGASAAEWESEEEGERPVSRSRLQWAARRVTRDLHDAVLLIRPAQTAEERSREVQRAVREGCVLRVLRLKRFFYSEAEAAGRVVAEDFFTRPDGWRRARPEPTALLEDWLEHLADVVEPTVEPAALRPIPASAWPLQEFVAAVSEVFDAFLKTLPADRRQWFAGTSTDELAF